MYPSTVKCFVLHPNPVKSCSKPHLSSTQMSPRFGADKVTTFWGFLLTNNDRNSQHNSILIIHKHFRFTEISLSGCLVGEQCIMNNIEPFVNDRIIESLSRNYVLKVHRKSQVSFKFDFCYCILSPQYIGEKMVGKCCPPVTF